MSDGGMLSMVLSVVLMVAMAWLRVQQRKRRSTQPDPDGFIVFRGSQADADERLAALADAGITAWLERSPDTRGESGYASSGSLAGAGEGTGDVVVMIDQAQADQAPSLLAAAEAGLEPEPDPDSHPQRTTELPLGGVSH